MGAADEVAGRAVDPNASDGHVAGHQLLHEDHRVALQLVEQRADAGRARRQARPRGVDQRHACGRGVPEIDRVGRAERADCGDGAAEVAVGRGGARPAAELELGRRREVGQALDARDAHRADAEPVAHRGAHAGRGGEHRPQREQQHDHGDDRGREPRRPPARRGAARRGSRATRACTAVARSGVARPGDVLAQGEQLKLELGHGAPTSSTPACARRRSSAREVRDFTVPRRQPSAAAVSSSESSSR